MGAHSQTTEFARNVAELTAQVPGVASIKPGAIRQVNGRCPERKVKLAFAVTGEIKTGVRMEIRSPGSVQTITAVCNRHQETMVAIARALRNSGVPICFEKNCPSP